MHAMAVTLEGPGRLALKRLFAALQVCFRPSALRAAGRIDRSQPAVARSIKVAGLALA